jgi:hypothetical protein
LASPRWHLYVFALVHRYHRTSASALTAIPRWRIGVAVLVHVGIAVLVHVPVSTRWRDSNAHATTLIAHIFS